MKKLLLILAILAGIFLASCQKNDSAIQPDNTKMMLPAMQYGDDILNNLYGQIYAVVADMEEDTAFFELYEECFNIGTNQNLEGWANSVSLSQLHETNTWQELDRIANDFFGDDIEGLENVSHEIVFLLISEIYYQGYMDMNLLYSWVEEYELNEIETMFLFFFNASCQYSITSYEMSYVIVNDGIVRRFDMFPINEYPFLQCTNNPYTIYEYYIDDDLGSGYINIPAIIQSGLFTHCDTLFNSSPQTLLEYIDFEITGGILYYNTNAECLEEWMNALAAERERYEQELNTIIASIQSTSDPNVLKCCETAIEFAAIKHQQIVRDIAARYRACCTAAQ